MAEREFPAAVKSVVKAWVSENDFRISEATWPALDAGILNLLEKASLYAHSQGRKTLLPKDFEAISAPCRCQECKSVL